MSRRRRVHGMRGVTPFIDMLFILLFGMLALSDAKQSANAEMVRVKLPTVEPGEDGGASESRALLIEVDASSRVRVGDEEVASPDSLDAALADLVGEELPEQVTIEIRADSAARHGVITALLQHLRRAGFRGVSLLALGAEDAGWGTDE